MFKPESDSDEVGELYRVVSKSMYQNGNALYVLLSTMLDT